MIKPLSPRSIAFLHVLLNRFHPENKKRLLQGLKEPLKSSILDLTISSNSLSSVMENKSTQLSSIHYTWLKDYILTFPESYIKPLVASLTNKQQISLIDELKLENLPKLTLVGKSYFSSILWDKTEEKSHLPLTLLPHFPLKSLAILNKAQLQKVIDYLGLHDLTLSIRTIVNKALIRSVFETLDTKERLFLKKIFNKKETVSSKKIPLETWTGNKEKLRILLHKRGIIRLGAALSGTDKELIWHIIKILDTGRGMLLKEQIKSHALPKITEKLIIQVEEILNFLDLKETP
jgi:hypothetical protein